MSFKNKVSTAFNWTKSCFNSSAWHDAARDHAKKTAPLIENIANSPKTTLVSVSIFTGVMYQSSTAKKAVKKTGQLAENIRSKLLTCSSKVIPTDKFSDAKPYKVAKAIGHGADYTAKIAGGAVVLAGLYAASNGATKIGKAIFLDRSKPAIKEAAIESWEDANALRHALQAVGDSAIGVVLNVTLDPAKWLVKGAWNQTLGRVFHHNDEQATDIAGDVIDAADQA